MKSDELMLPIIQHFNCFLGQYNSDDSVCLYHWYDFIINNNINSKLILLTHVLINLVFFSVFR